MQASRPRPQDDLLAGLDATLRHDPGGKVRLRVPPGIVSDAAFSECGRYRWWLERRWDGRPIGAGDVAVMVAANPSTAGLHHDDPTVRGCCDRARLWGYGGLLMLNALAYRSTSPAGLLEVEDPNGPLNDETIRHLAPTGGVVVVGWGNLPKPLRGRGAEVARLLADVGVQPMCFAANADGSPKHPLYVRRDAALLPWVPDKES